MQVAIYEKNIVDLSKLETFISYYTSDYFSYTDGNRLVRDIKESRKLVELFLLDIESGDFSGIEIAKQIRAISPNSLIIFLANYEEYMPQVFQIRTFDYLLKPITQKKLDIVLQRAIYYLNIDKKYFKFAYKKINYLFNVDDIFYFEKKGRTAFIYHRKGIYQCNMTTLQILKQLNKSIFIQIHASYIVNLNHMHGYTSKFILVNNIVTSQVKENIIQLPIGGKYKNSTKTSISNFLKSR